MSQDNLDPEHMHQWVANTAAPVVNVHDLRFSETAYAIESEDGSQNLVERFGEGDNEQWIMQRGDGSQEQLTDKQVRYGASPVFSDQRIIRVFLSSTFRDMQVERRHLVTTVFPRLRKLALSLGVQLQEIDLRWGITLEEAHSGRTVAICLNEIDRCRKCPPFFIGMMGERYGWIPDAAALEELDQAMATRPAGTNSQSLRDTARREAYSVTEMEIRYGVLDTPQMHSHAFFYTRAPELTRMFAQHAEDPAADTIYYEGSHDLAVRQQALKQELRERGLVRMDGYRSVEELGHDIEQAISAAIRRVARAANAIQIQRPGPLPLAWDENQIWSKNLADRHIDLFRLPQAESVAALWSVPGPPGKVRVLLLGPPGYGKAHEAVELASALAYLGTETISLHCRMGAIASVDGALSYLRSVLTAFGAIPPSDLPVRQGWVEALNAVEGHFIVQLFDIDCLQNCDDLLSLISLVQNPRIAFLLTSSDDSLGERTGGLFQVIRVGELDTAAREDFTKQYLAAYRKSLDAGLMRKLVGLPMAGSPLFLTLLLEHLCQNAVFETLEKSIEDFAEVKSLDQAVVHSIRNWLSFLKADPDAAGPWRLALQVLCVARHGVPEDFFYAANGANLSPLQFSTWCGLAQSLMTDVGGYWRFANGWVRDVVQHLYLASDPDPMAEAAARRALARFIDATPEPGDTIGLHERVQQLVWLTLHTKDAADAASLHDMVVVPDNVGKLSVIDRALLIDAWRSLVQIGYPVDPLVGMIIASGDANRAALLDQMLIELGLWPQLERVASTSLTWEPSAQSVNLEYHLAVALANQGRPREALQLIAPRLEAWAMAPGDRLAPITCTILLGLVSDGLVDVAPWSKVINAAIQSLPSTGPSSAPEQEAGLIVGLVPILLEAQNFEFVATLGQRGLLLSYSLPGSFGARIRLMLGFPMICAFRMQGKFQEAVALGHALMTEQCDPFREETLLRARCARGTGLAMLDLKRWNEALALLEIALEHEPQNDTDFVPLLINSGFMVKALLELGQHARMRSMLEIFVGYCSGQPGLGQQIRDFLLGELRGAQHLDDARWLESAVP